MWVNTEVFIAGGRALRDEYPRESREVGARCAVEPEAVMRQPRLADRLLRRVGALLIVSGQRLQDHAQPRSYKPVQA